MSEDDEIAASIERHGWHAIAVAESPYAPSFLYTIGLCAKLSHPDLIVLGLEQHKAYSLVAALVGEVASGRSLSAAGTYDAHGLGRIGIRPVHSSQHRVYLGYAMGYYRHIGTAELLRAVQVFWPDQAGLFPFDLRCKPEVAYLQPRLELPADSVTAEPEW